jgi:hypothetical protein
MLQTKTCDLLKDLDEVIKIKDIPVHVGHRMLEVITSIHIHPDLPPILKTTTTLHTAILLHRLPPTVCPIIMLAHQWRSMQWNPRFLPETLSVNIVIAKGYALLVDKLVICGLPAHNAGTMLG